jgi:hypothetical protein
LKKLSLIFVPESIVSWNGGEPQIRISLEILGYSAYPLKAIN